MTIRHGIQVLHLWRTGRFRDWPRLSRWVLLALALRADRDGQFTLPAWVEEDQPQGDT